MILPSKRTSPSPRAPGTVSCMRLRQRSSVDLPHPDGPMIAVTSPAATVNAPPLTTRDPPKNASRDSTAIHGWGSITAKSELRACREARGKTDDDDEREEDDGARPGLRTPFVVWRGCI